MLVSELVCERSSYAFLHVGFLGWFLGRMYFTCLILLVNLYTGTFFLCKDFFKCKMVTLIKSDRSVTLIKTNALYVSVYLKWCLKCHFCLMVCMCSN